MPWTPCITMSMTTSATLPTYKRFKASTVEFPEATITSGKATWTMSQSDWESFEEFDVISNLQHPWDTTAGFMDSVTLYSTMSTIASGIQCVVPYTETYTYTWQANSDTSLQTQSAYWAGAVEDLEVTTTTVSFKLDTTSLINTRTGSIMQIKPVTSSTRRWQPTWTSASPFAMQCLAGNLQLQASMLSGQNYFYYPKTIVYTVSSGTWSITNATMSGQTPFTLGTYTFTPVYS